MTGCEYEGVDGVDTGETLGGRSVARRCRQADKGCWQKGRKLWIRNRVRHDCLRIELKKEFRGSSKDNPVMFHFNILKGIRNKDVWAKRSGYAVSV